MKRTNKNKTQTITVFIAIFAFLSISAMLPQMSLINEGTIENNNIIGEDFDFSNLKTSAGEINITTPEDKTYTSSMSGYYPGTYSFDNDAVDSAPQEWTDTSESGSYAKVISALGGHNKVIELMNPTVSSICLNQSFAPQVTGTIEWWWYKSSTTTSCAKFRIAEDGVGGQLMDFRMDWYADPNKLEYYDGGWLNTGYGYSDNTWIHMSLTFDTNTDMYNLTVDGTPILTNIDLYVDAGYVDSIFFYSYGPSNPTLYYVDAISYSWDTDYTLGDNKDEGLLLSFDNSTDLEWMGYSLDGQTIKTILGNTTIPTPGSNGTHSIQVFGNNSIGTDFQSDIRYFNINSPTPYIDIITPLNKDYTTPMSGYYPGTFGFDGDANGGVPYGWVDSCQPAGSIQMIQSAGGHNKVMELTSTSAASSRSQMDHDFDDRDNGTIELWMRKSSVNQNGPMVLYIYGASAGALINIMIDDDVNPGFVYSGPSSTWINPGYSYSDDTWIHMRIEWNCTSDTWNLWIDGVQYVTNSAFAGSNTDTAIDWMRFSSYEGGNPSVYYVDAIGFSWDPNYNVGDNRNEGLLLSYDNNTNLEWQGYSLDGQPNVTINGNTSITTPVSNGTHSIQVFGNDSLWTDIQSDIRYFGINSTTPSINITTPENKTYTSAMSGYHPGTFGFDGDANGGVPYGWVDSSQTNGAIQMIQSADGHNKVMELTSTSAALSRSQLDHDFEDRDNGTIELWFYKSSVNQGGPMVLYIYGASAGTLMNFIIDDDVTPGLRYVDPSGSWTDTGYSYSDDTWIHMRIEWDCTSDTWNLWVDGVQYLTNIAFESSRTDTAVDWMRFSSFEGGNPSLYYVDAVGFSWDPNYNVGDNRKEGLLLSYDNNTNLEWQGYSLDGQSNITISGNTTIPMPDAGLHSIQVFGNVTSGMIIESDIIYFTISEDIITPGTPKIFDMTGDNPSLYIIVQTNAYASLEVISTTTNLVGKGLGTNLEVFYFYNISIFDSNNNENDSVLTSITIRLYFNPSDIKKLDNLRVLHAVYIGSVFSLWETVEITVNEAENYVEFTTTELSVFALAEVKIPPGQEDNPFIVFLVENMLWIIILAAIGVAAPSMYVVRSKKQKKNTEMGKKTALEQYKDLEFADTMEAKAKKKREALEKRTWKPEERSMTEKIGIKAKKKPIKPLKKPLKKPKKSLDISSIPIDAIAEAQQKREEEIKQTEKEVVLEQKIDTCQVHKGKIEGISYICPKCQAKYCLKCAKTLKQKVESCWVCDTVINIELEEPGIKIPEVLDKKANGLEPISSAHIDNSFLLERIKRDEDEDNMSIFRGLNLTTISEGLISKIGQLKMDDEDKTEFIKEILALPPEEREDFVDEIVEKTKEFESK